MGILEDAVVKAKDFADVAGKKANDLITLQKLRYKLSSLNAQMGRDYELLGRMQYDLIRKGEKVDTLILDQIEKIDDLKEEIEEVNRMIADQKGQVICPACKTAQEDEATFCSRCGIKLDSEQAAQDKASEAADAADKAAKAAEKTAEAASDAAKAAKEAAEDDL